MKAHLCTALLSGVLTLPAYATSGFTPATGESGGTWHAIPSTITREQVKAELAAWTRNPVTADGWRQFNSESRWEYVGSGSSAAATSRPQVMQELADFRRNPVSPDGWAFVDGEIGWVFVGTGKRVMAAPRAGGPGSASDGRIAETRTR